MTSIVLIGTFDTKGIELDYLRRKIVDQGLQVCSIDVGVMGSPQTPVDVEARTVAAAAKARLEDLRTNSVRSAAIETMARGATEIISKRHRQTPVQAIIALGGSGGTTICSAAMRALPFGIPKLLISTVASGQVSGYVGTSDIMMYYSVADLAGLNHLTARVLENAAAAIVGMAKGAEYSARQRSSRPVIAVTMFGVTSSGAEVAREWLECHGYEVIVFHANGSGGRAMEQLVRERQIDGVLDFTTTELADEIVGGTLSAGPERLEIAGALGVPQVVSLGAMDVVNFGARGTVPDKFGNELFVEHNANVTLMRTPRRFSGLIGETLANKLNKSRGPTAVFVPGAGFSALSANGEPFADPDSDAALVKALADALAPSIAVVRSPANINDPELARSMANTLDQFMKERGT